MARRRVLVSSWLNENVQNIIAKEILDVSAKRSKVRLAQVAACNLDAIRSVISNSRWLQRGMPTLQQHNVYTNAFQTNNKKMYYAIPSTTCSVAIITKIGDPMGVFADLDVQFLGYMGN